MEIFDSENGVGSQNRSSDVILLGLVIAVATVFAAVMLANYAADPGELWRGLNADRNGHFAFGVDVALALKNLDIFDFVDKVINARLWPPVHGLVLAFVLLWGDLDLRLAIVPNLVAWVSTIVLTFLITRRMFVDRLSGNVAGAIAIAFAMASPAFRLITADVYLEGLGAALTAWCCYAYVRAREPHGDTWWGVLAVSLTFLFFEKSNFWALTVVPAALAFLWEDVPGWVAWTRAQVERIDIRSLALGVIRDPYIIAAAVVIVVVATLYARGPTAIVVFGQRVSLYPPENLVTATWGLLVIRAALLWRQHRQSFDAAIQVAGQRLFYWHLLPIAISLLIPKRLSTFLWYMGPANTASQTYNPVQALLFHWETFSQGFHVASWVAILVIALFVVAAVRIKRLPPGARAIFLIAVVSAFAVVFHPNQQGRFQTSWLPTVWIMAGVGGAIILSSITAWLPTLGRAAVAAAIVAGVGFAESRYRWTDVAYLSGMALRSGPTDLDLAKGYLPHLRSAQTVGFLVSFPFEDAFFHWSIRLDCRCRVRIDHPWLVPWQSREQYRQAAIDWLNQTRSDRIVVIDGPIYEYLFLGMSYERLSGQIGVIENDGRFERIATQEIPSSKAVVSVWRRRQQ